MGRAVTIRRRRFRDLDRIGGKWGNKGISGVGVWILSRSFTGKYHCEGQLKLKVFVRCGGDGGGGAVLDDGSPGTGLASGNGGKKNEAPKFWDSGFLKF